jgi:hypothetical protein
MFISSPSPCLWQHYMSSFLMTVSLQKRLDEFVIMLQYMYPKCFTLQSAILSRKTATQELSENILFEYCIGFLSNVCHVTDTTPFHIHAD